MIENFQLHGVISNHILIMIFFKIYLFEFRENQMWDVEVSNFTNFSEKYERSWENMFFLHVGLKRNSIRGGMAFVVPGVGNYLYSFNKNSLRIGILIILIPFFTILL